MSTSTSTSPPPPAPTSTPAPGQKFAAKFSRRRIPAPGSYFVRPLITIWEYKSANLRSDLTAGLTVGVILLPQAIAFALIAGLPPQMGLYTAIVGPIIGGLWGSSNHLHTGPSNTASLLVFSVLSPLFIVGSPDYITAAGLLALMVGIFRLGVCMARLGILANFVSDSVIVGFTSGAGIFLAIGQFPNLLGISLSAGGNAFVSLSHLFQALSQTHLPSLFLGLSGIALLVLLKRYRPKLPGPLTAMILGAGVVAILGLNEQGVMIIGDLPRSLPPLTRLPIFDLVLIGQLSSGALALGAIGLVEAASISRSIAARSRQRLDSNQEFVGQGLASISAALLSGYPLSGSFNRSAANYEAGATSPISSVVSGIFVLVAMLLLGPAAAFIPKTILAAVLVVIGYSMVNRAEMVRIWHGSRPDAAIMVVTLMATLLLPLQFAVLTGILMSLANYILQTSTPLVLSVLPTDDFKHFLHQPEKPPCPQLGIITIVGDLYFGAVNHVEDLILAHKERHPGQRFLLLRMQNVNRMDISGIHMLESVVRTYAEAGGEVYFTKVKGPIQQLMDATDFSAALGDDHLLIEEEAITHLFYRVLDPAVCIYECEVRAFKECQNLPKSTIPNHLLLQTDTHQIVRHISPLELWQELHWGIGQPEVIDVREEREYLRGHIRQAQLFPMSRFDPAKLRLGKEKNIVLVCRSGRRSERVAQALQQAGFTQVRTLTGGMVAWEASGLLEVVDPILLARG